MMGSIGLVEIVILAAIVGGMVLVALVMRGFAAGGSSLQAQITAAQQASSGTSQRLTAMRVTPGARFELRCTAAGPNEHGIWLDYVVTTTTSSGVWSAEVAIEWEAAHLTHAQRFAIGYDGEDHQTGPGVIGLTYVPKPGSTPSNVEDGTLKIGLVRGAPLGAALTVRCTITPTTPVTDVVFDVFVSV